MHYLHRYASTGNVSAVKAHLDAGADPNAYDESFDTPLQIAARKGHHEVVKTLLEKGANPNKRWNGLKSTPLISAVRRGRRDIVETLLKKGANPNLHLREYQPLDIAIRRGNAAMTKTLLNRGANPDIRNSYGESPMDYVSSSRSRSNVNILHALAAAGANPFTAPGVSAHAPRGRSHVPFIRETTTLLRLPEHVPYGNLPAAPDLDKENAITYEPIDGSKFYIKPRRNNTVKNVTHVYSRNTIQKLLNTTAKDPYTQRHFYAKNVYALREKKPGLLERLFGRQKR